ncbi:MULTISPECIES: hypothetical protein [unclassified Streptomyces]
MEALTDTGTDPVTVASVIDSIADVRQFKISMPGTCAPLGLSGN